MQRFKQVGVVLDLKHDNENALARAAELVQTNEAHIHCLCILPKGIDKEQAARIDTSLKKQLAFPFTLHHTTGKALIDITHYTAEHKLNILLIEPDNEQNALNRFFQGSLALSLMRKAPCPVWVVKKTASTSCERILIAVDPDESSQDSKLNDKLIQIGTSYAQRHHAECHLVTAWVLEGETTLQGPFVDTTPDEIEQLKMQRKTECARAFKMLQDRHRELLQGCKTDMIYGEPGYALAEFTKEHDISLIIMGTLARAGIPGFLIGNTAETIANQVDCSIMAIKPDGFISPILA